MERQKAGFVYQEDVINRFNLTPDKNYTGHWDAYAKGVPVSIKLEKRNSDVEMADFFRQATITQDFILIVGFWEKEKSNIVEEKVLFIPTKEWNNFFDTSFIPLFQQLLNNFSNDRKDDEKWKREIKKFKKQWEEKTPNLIRPRFKRDHKKQKRIQCAINNKDFFSYFVKKYEIGGI